MKLHLITIGTPKLDYAKIGWTEYIKRLGHFHNLRISHLSDRQNTAKNILAAAGKAHIVALVIDGPQLSSHDLATFLDAQSVQGRELCFIIGGPDGLPSEVIAASQTKLSFSKLTFPHDLAMVILAEALYRASTISDGHPYHH